MRDLLRAHPVTFRPFLQSVTNLCIDLLSSSVAGDVETLVCEIWVSRHLCASSNKRDSSGAAGGKANAVATEWGVQLDGVINESHRALDTIFEPILEDNRESTAVANIGLKPVEGGIFTHTDRLLVLLRLIQTFFSLPTASASVHIPVGSLFDLATRVFAVLPTSPPNPVIEKSVRDLLFSRLSEIHAACCNMLCTVATRLRTLLVPHVAALLDQAEFIFSPDFAVRTSVYHLTSTLLDLAGPGLPKDTVSTLHPILTAVAADLTPMHTAPAPPPGSGTPSANSGGRKQKAAHADSFLASSQSLTVPQLTTPPGVFAAASWLLEVALRTLPAEHVRPELRTRLDRAAVLTNNRDAVLASTMFPPPRAKASLLPHLVGAAAAAGRRSLAIEAVVRPRMPVVWTAPMRRDLPPPDANDNDDEYSYNFNDGHEQLHDSSFHNNTRDFFLAHQQQQHQHQHNGGGTSGEDMHMGELAPRSKRPRVDGDDADGSGAVLPPLLHQQPTTALSPLPSLFDTLFPGQPIDSLFPSSQSIESLFPPHPITAAEPTPVTASPERQHAQPPPMSPLPPIPPLVASSSSSAAYPLPTSNDASALKLLTASAQDGLPALERELGRELHRELGRDPDEWQRNDPSPPHPQHDNNTNNNSSNGRAQDGNGSRMGSRMNSESRGGEATDLASLARFAVEMVERDTAAAEAAARKDSNAQAQGQKQKRASHSHSEDEADDGPLVIPEIIMDEDTSDDEPDTRARGSASASASAKARARVGAA